MNRAPSNGLGLIGGGRWARVIASVLSRMEVGPVQLASEGNPAAWDTCPKRWRRTDIAAMLSDPSISRVIVARRARDHAGTVLAALAAGKEVLVEKPFCLSREQADRILASARGRICQTGLVFLHAPNQQRFREACLSAGPVTGGRVVWTDGSGEERHGAAKQHDASLNPVQDVLPHVWSLLRPLVGEPMTLRDAAPTGDGAGVDLTLVGPAGAEFAIEIARGGPARTRVIELAGAGYRASLDFATEPGEALMNGRTLDVVSGHRSPLLAELEAFLHGPLHPLADVAQAVEALDLSLAALALIRRHQATAIRVQLHDPDTAALNALREVATGGIAGDGGPSALADVAAWLGLAEGDAALARAWTLALSDDRRMGSRRPHGWH